MKTRAARLDVGGRVYVLERYSTYEVITFAERVLSLLDPAPGMAPDMAPGSSHATTRGTRQAQRAQQGQQGRQGRRAQRAQPPPTGFPGKFFAALGAPEAATLLRNALDRCRTPEDEPLRDKDVFRAWFEKHPADLYELALRAVYELVREYLVEAARYRRENIKQDFARQSGAHLPIPCGWQARAFAERLGEAGICSPLDLIRNNISLRDFFELMHILDWREHLRAKSASFA